MNLMELVAIYLALVYLVPFYWIGFWHCSARLWAVRMCQRASFASICSKETEKKWQVKHLQMNANLIFNHGARNWMQITLQMGAFKPNPSQTRIMIAKTKKRHNSKWNRFLFLPYILLLPSSRHRFKVCVFYVLTKIDGRALFVTHWWLMSACLSKSDEPR